MVAKNKHRASEGRNRTNKIRVLLANLPGTVTEYIEQSLHQQLDIQLLGHVQGNVALLTAVDWETDVLILGADKTSPPPGICSHLFGEFPDLKIIVLAGDQASVYRMTLHRQQIGPLSTVDPLLNHIRQVYDLDSGEIRPTSAKPPDVIN